MNLLNSLKTFLGLIPEYYRGIDTSVYEPNINWPLVKTQDVNYVFMRASQGTYKDPEFVRMWSEAKEIMPRGAYHLFDGRYTSNKPSRQVEIFLEQLNGDFGELPFILDIEGIFATGGGYPFTGWKYWYDYLEALKTQVPEKEIIIYTAPYVWRDNTPAPGTPELNYFKQYPLWIAHYGVTTPLVPAPWGNWLTGEWTFWQYSESGLIDGINNEVGRQTSVDLNYYNGNESDFILRFGLGNVDPEPPEGDMITHKGKVITARGANIRPEPNTNNVAIGSAVYDTDLEIDEVKIITEKVEEWLHLVTPQEGWMAAYYNGEKIVDYWPVSTFEPVEVLLQLFDDNGNEIYEPQTVIMQPKV